MSDTFKFNDYKYKVEPEFKDKFFTKMEELINKSIVIDFVKFYDAKAIDGSATKAVRFSYKIVGDETPRYSYTKSYGIVAILQNIMEDVGAIPEVPVKVITIQTKTGNKGYAFDDN